jgi:hypothetical protein
MHTGRFKSADRVSESAGLGYERDWAEHVFKIEGSRKSKYGKTVRLDYGIFYFFLHNITPAYTRIQHHIQAG